MPPVKKQKKRGSKADPDPFETIDERVFQAQSRLRNRPKAQDKQHQCNVLEFMKSVADPSKSHLEEYDTKGLLVAHGMGSGKTLTALWVAKEYIAKSRVAFVNILAPNVAVGEFIESFEKAGITPYMAGQIRVLTHDEFSINRRKRDFGSSLVIVDEAHMFQGIKYDALVKSDAAYLLLLSGTPAPNEPCEIVPLINLLYRDRKMWWTEKKWNNKKTTLGDKKKFLKNKLSMHNIGSKYNYMKKRGTVVDANNHFPGYKVSSRTVKLSSSQNAAYLSLLKKKKTETKRQSEKYPFYTRERAIVNTHPKRKKGGGGEVTPKIAKVAKDVVREIKKSRKDKKDTARLERGRLLLYAYNKDVTEDLDGEVRRLCAEQKVYSPRIALYNGSTSQKKRADIKESFNNGDLDLLIISKAGSVGLDLQCTSKVFMYDLWWNIPQMNQVIGRAIRFKSHQLPCKHNHVDVYIYNSKFSTTQKRGMRVFDQQILTDAVKKWKEVSNMIEKVMKPSSIKNSKSCQK